MSSKPNSKTNKQLHAEIINIIFEEADRRIRDIIEEVKRNYSEDIFSQKEKSQDTMLALGARIACDKILEKWEKKIYDTKGN